MQVILVCGILISLIIFLGYREIISNEDKQRGLSTWMFACAPFLGLLALVGMNKSLNIFIKVFIIAFLIIASWRLLLLIYRDAIKKSEAKKNDD